MNNLKYFYKFNVLGIWHEITLSTKTHDEIMTKYEDLVKKTLEKVDSMAIQNEYKPIVLQVILQPFHFFEENIARNLLEKKLSPQEENT